MTMEMEYRDQIRPCPFCHTESGSGGGWSGEILFIGAEDRGHLRAIFGEEYRVAQDAADRAIRRTFQVQCWHCGARGPAGLTQDEAIAAWNDLDIRPMRFEHAVIDSDTDGVLAGLELDDEGKQNDERPT